MSEITPAKLGILVDYISDRGTFDEHILPTLQLVVDDFLERGLLERPVEFVVRAVQGLPNGSFRAVRDAFHELVDEDVLVIFGPWVSENGVPLRPYVEELAEVPCITMGGTETMLGEWVFGLPAGSMEEEPIIMATVAAARRLPNRRHRVRGLADRPRVPAHDPRRVRRTPGCASPPRCRSRRWRRRSSAAMEVLAAEQPDAHPARRLRSRADRA